MKRIIICMDGTWQSLNQDNLTNIGILARSIAHKEKQPDGSFVEQIVIYTQGVGSSIGALSRRSFFEEASYTFNRLAGGAFGEGLEDGILDTYLRLAFDYEKGDEIYIFGFSRGAFAARRLAGLINTAGIVSRRHVDRAREGFRIYYEQPGDDATPEQVAEHEAKARAFRMDYGKGGRNPDGTRLKLDDVPPIQFLGVFDTVAQRGFADVVAAFTPWKDKLRYSFKHYHVPANVLNARHACATDEARLGFPVLLWDSLEQDNQRAGRADAYMQRWFIGTHGDIGGGEGSKLSAQTLKWMAEGAHNAGLRFYATYGDDQSPLDEALQKAGLCFDGVISRPKSFWKALQPMNYPLRARKVWARKEKPTVQDLTSYFDASVLERYGAENMRPRYRPQQLKPFKGVMKEWDPRLK